MNFKNPLQIGEITFAIKFFSQASLRLHWGFLLVTYCNSWSWKSLNRHLRVGTVDGHFDGVFISWEVVCDSKGYINRPCSPVHARYAQAFKLPKFLSHPVFLFFFMLFSFLFHFPFVILENSLHINNYITIKFWWEFIIRRRVM